MKHAWQSIASLIRSTMARSTRSRSSVEETVLMTWYRYRLSTPRCGSTAAGWSADVCEADISASYSRAVVYSVGCDAEARGTPRRQRPRVSEVKRSAQVEVADAP